MNTPKIKLKPIDLSKTVIDGNRTTHPDINTKKHYLVKCGGRYAAGQFNMQWYGLNFKGFYDAGHQFDPPGVNGSDWEAVWEIIPQ